MIKKKKYFYESNQKKKKKYMVHLTLKKKFVKSHQCDLVKNGSIGQNPHSSFGGRRFEKVIQTRTSRRPRYTFWPSAKKVVKKPLLRGCEG